MEQFNFKQVRMASGINILVGAWLIASPWIVHYSRDAFLNNVAVGIAVAALATWSGRSTYAEARQEHRPA